MKRLFAVMLFMSACSSSSSSSSSGEVACSTQFGGSWKFTDTVKTRSPSGTFCDSFRMTETLTAVVAADLRSYTQTSVGETASEVTFVIDPVALECNRLIATRVEKEDETVYEFTRTLQLQPNGSLAGEMTVTLYPEAEGRSATICTAVFTTTWTR